MTWVAVLMGSESDWEVMRGCTEVLESLGVDFEVRVTSAHRTPRETAEYVADAISRDCGAFICAAGLAAHLAGAVAANTIRPVIGVPMGGPLAGVDSLLSTVQMPGGIPVATVAIGSAGAKNAAYLAAQILAIDNSALSKALLEDREANLKKVQAQNASVQGDLGR